MGKTSIIATDIFFCLFGVFAVLREISPHYEFATPVFQGILIEWSSPAEQFCIFSAKIKNGLSSGEELPDKKARYDSSQEKCYFYKKIESGGSSDIEISLLIPVRDNNNILVKIDNDEIPCDNCDPGLKQPELIYKMNN